MWAYVHATKNHADRPACQEEMVRGRATLFKGRNKVTRQQRRALGPLRNLAVQPPTRAGHDKALEKFRAYLRRAFWLSRVRCDRVCPRLSTIGEGEAFILLEADEDVVNNRAAK